MQTIECQECGSCTDAQADCCPVCCSELRYDPRTSVPQHEAGLKRLGGALVSGGVLGGALFLGHWLLLTGSFFIILTGIAGLTLGFLFE